MTLALIERFYDGDFRTRSCPTEQDYYDCWRACGLDKMAPTEAAIAGAFVADRLPWVFAAGYQATLRNAFADLPDGGWAAFAATEDSADLAAHPPVTLSDDGSHCRLDGCKAWVAHSAIVDHLIVTINDPAGDKRRVRGVVVSRHGDGVHLSHREKPGFLARMSQGFARFEGTPVSTEGVFEFEAIRQFGRSEAKFVMLSSSAFMLSRTGPDSSLQARLATVVAALLSLIAETKTSRQVYADIDTEFQACVDLFEQTGAPDEIPEYEADRRLFRMYTDRIQRRREYAQADAAKRKA